MTETLKQSRSRVIERDGWQQLATPNKTRPSGALVLFVGLLYASALAMLWWGAGWKVALGGLLLIWASNTERNATRRTK